MTDVTVDEITRRGVYFLCASRYFRIYFATETRKREEFVSANHAGVAKREDRKGRNIGERDADSLACINFNLRRNSGGNFAD